MSIAQVWLAGDVAGWAATASPLAFAAHAHTSRQPAAVRAVDNLAGRQALRRENRLPPACGAVEKLLADANNGSLPGSAWSASALRAGLAERAEDWRWLSLWRWRHPEAMDDVPLLTDWPLQRRGSG